MAFRFPCGAHHDFVVTPKWNKGAISLPSDQPVENCTAIRSAVHVVAQRNQPVVRRKRDVLLQRRQRRETTVDVTDGENPHLLPLLRRIWNAPLPEPGNVADHAGGDCGPTITPDATAASRASDGYRARRLYASVTSASHIELSYRAMPSTAFSVSTNMSSTSSGILPSRYASEPLRVCDSRTSP